MTALERTKGIKVSAYLKIKFSTYIQFESGTILVTYICQYLSSGGKTYTIKVKQFYDNLGMIRENDTEWFITGELLNDVYKDKDGNWVDKGAYILVEEPAWICKEDDSNKNLWRSM